MGKSWKRGGDRKFSDDLAVYSKNEIEYREHKKEKRIIGALKTKNVNALYEPDEEDNE
jgi:hypothetical protein